MHSLRTRYGDRCHDVHLVALNRLTDLLHLGPRSAITHETAQGIISRDYRKANKTEDERNVNRTVESIDGLVQAFAQAQNNLKALEENTTRPTTPDRYLRASQEHTPGTFTRHDVTHRRIRTTHVPAYERQADPFEGSSSPAPTDSQPTPITSGQRDTTHIQTPDTERRQTRSMTQQLQALEDTNTSSTASQDGNNHNKRKPDTQNPIENTPKKAHQTPTQQATVSPQHSQDTSTNTDNMSSQSCKPG